MKDCAKYAGIIPAFYACYGRDGQIIFGCEYRFSVSPGRREIIPSPRPW